MLQAMERCEDNACLATRWRSRFHASARIAFGPLGARAETCSAESICSTDELTLCACDLKIDGAAFLVGAANVRLVSVGGAGRSSSPWFEVLISAAVRALCIRAM